MGKRNGKRTKRDPPGYSSNQTAVEGGFASSSQTLGLSLVPDKNVAKPPFDQPGIDSVTFVTEDQVTFYINRGVLLMTSRYFEEKLKSESKVKAAISCPCPSFILDTLLRSVHPIDLPVFKDAGISHDSLPYLLLGVIYNQAKKFGMDYVCSSVNKVASDLVFNNMVPSTGPAAFRLYGAVCLLNSSHELKF
jgi:hypothetical protein